MRDRSAGDTVTLLGAGYRGSILVDAKKSVVYVSRGTAGEVNALDFDGALVATISGKERGSAPEIDERGPRVTVNAVSSQERLPENGRQRDDEAEAQDQPSPPRLARLSRGRLQLDS
jgi:hypothetical protein